MRTHRLLRRPIFRSTFALVATALFLWSAEAAGPEKKNESGRMNKPDRSKVMPMFTEGVVMRGSTIFTYVDGGRRRRLSLDVFAPAEAEGSRPAIVMYFGGGWQNGRPALFHPLAQRLAQRGYVCVVPEYRLTREAPFPAQVHDAKAAVRWTRKFAGTIGADPGRIATMGGSAGGHLAGFLAASNGVERFEGSGDHREVSSDVQAAVVMCGPMTLLDPVVVKRVEKAAATGGTDLILEFLDGALPSRNRAAYEEASPLTHLSERSPPMLFIDGENDRPRERYTGFWKKMNGLGIDHEFELMPGGPHPFWVYAEWFEPTVDAVDGFLREHFPVEE